MKTNGATIITTLLERQGVETISGIPGGANLPLYDALHDSQLRHVLARHEQGAGFIAHGQARVSGRAAVCLATSGPGVTNLLTAIADARLDSVPLVAITGQVPLALIGTDAFQEVDTYGLTLPITKHNFLVKRVEELLEVIPLAFEIAESGRPGPVVVDVPKDVLQQTMDVAAWPEPGRARAVSACSDEQIENLARALEASERPMLYLGGGIASAGAQEAVRQLAREQAIPSVSTLMGLGVMPPASEHYLGMLGMHGAPAANLLLAEADFLFAIGARFDDRATGKLAEFCPRATVAHIDIDPAELGKNKAVHIGLCGDARDIVTRLNRILRPRGRTGWLRRVREVEVENAAVAPAPHEDPLYPHNLFQFLGSILPSDTIVTTDVGQHQMWVAQSYPFRQPRTLLTSGGLGTMGFGLPAAIGAALESPGRRVICVSGDGSLMMNIQELATLAELDLPVAVLICNNANLGLVRQQQELFYGGRFQASSLAHAPDFAALARAFGLRGCRIDPDGDVQGELRRELARPGPCVIDIPIHEQRNVYPMVPPGAPNTRMILEVAHV